MNLDRIHRRAKIVDEENSVRQLAIRTHASLISYFGGNDITGKIKGRNDDVFRAFLMVLEGRDHAALDNYRSLAGPRLESELENAFREAGFTDNHDELMIPARGSYSELPSGSIGPLLPGMLAILEVEYGIDSTEAVRQYRSDAVETVEGGNTRSKPDVPSLSKWEESVRGAPGFEPNAGAYIYVLELERLTDNSTWYYVGKSEGGFSSLISRTRSHTSNFNNQRVIQQDGGEILCGDYNASVARPERSHRVLGVDRIVSLSPDRLDQFDNTERAKCHIREIERRTAYEVALDHDTTNVLGGK